MFRVIIFLKFLLFFNVTGIRSKLTESNNGGAETCQCGVFLLGTPPLQFSEDATPTLAGNPVSANCSSLLDRTRCANDCQRLVRAMSNQENSALVQTIVLSATKALACQRFNASAKVPLPRIHLGGFNWRKEEFRSTRATDPRWLGGFYRWCDSHWIYAGVSSPDPLCCLNGLPVKCPETEGNDEGNVINNRSPRLIIKKRPEDDISSEEVDQDDTDSTANGISTTESSTTSNPSNGTNNDDGSMEKLEPFTTPKPEESESTLNSTILADAFQFVGALMKTLGMGEVVEGITTVLPATTATELLKRVDVGGWVTKYQASYIAYGREFNLGYCYLEYGLYSVANEGVGSIVNRVFGGSSKSNRRVRRATSRISIRKIPRRSANNSINFMPQVSSVPNPAFTGPTVTPVVVRTPIAKPLIMNSAPLKETETRSNTLFGNVETGRKASFNSEITRSTKKTTNRQGGNQGPNFMQMANMLMQIASSASNSGGGGGSDDPDKVNPVLQNALPLLGQVVTSPMVQGVVSNLVTNFLTPPDNGGANRPGGGAPVKKPMSSHHLVSHGEESNEIEPIPRPPSSRPPAMPPQNNQESGLTGMLGQIVQTYLKHYFSSKNPPRPPTSTSRPVIPKNPDKKNPTGSSSSSNNSPQAEERTDIVDTISEVAKPFFISYFGVVPGIPGFGQLNIAERSGRLREDVLTYDPDPGSSITDFFLGSSHLPSTGNTIFDLGNRIVYAFSRANDPTQGLYCIKQYSVNKLWDGFRFGVKTLFK